MYRTKSKRRLLAERLLVYSIMTLTVVVVVTVSFLYTVGYRFDEKDRKVELSGLVQFNSFPGSAIVEIDSVRQTQTTPMKRALHPGVHEFVMWREGYESWRKTVNIEAGTLNWLNYARLIPKQLTVESIADMSGATGALASPDNRYMATVGSEEGTPSVSFYEINRDKPTIEQVQFKSSDYESSTDKSGHSFRLHQWSHDSRRVLVEHVYKKQRSWIVVDRTSGQVVANVSRLFDIDISQLYFPEGNSGVLYAQTNDTIRRVEIGSSTMSAPLVTDVDSFSVGERAVGYITKPDKVTGNRSAGVMRYGEKPVLIHDQVSEGAPLQIAVGYYYKQDYIVVSDGNEITVYRGEVPITAQGVSTLSSVYRHEFSEDLRHIEFSPGGRIVTIYAGKRAFSYDLEHAILFEDVDNGNALSGSQRFGWADDYYLWSDASSDGILTLREFDGANISTIAAVEKGYDVSITPNGTYLYFVGMNDKNTLEMQRVRLILR